MDDADRFDAIVNIIKNRIYFPVGGNASHAHIVVRSASLPASELEQIALRLKAANKFSLSDRFSVWMSCARGFFVI